MKVLLKTINSVEPELYITQTAIRSIPENQFSGDGILYYPDKTVQYEGTFENGAFNGEGVLYNEQGIMIYEGNFQSGAYHGQGTSYYDSGIKKYEGEFYMEKAYGMLLPEENSSKDSLPEIIFSMNLFWVFRWKMRK